MRVRAGSSQSFFRTSSQAVLILRHIVTGTLTPTESVRSSYASAGTAFSGSVPMGFVSGCSQFSSVSGRNAVGRLSCEQSRKGGPILSVRSTTPAHVRIGTTRCARLGISLRSAPGLSMSTANDATKGSDGGGPQGYSIWADEADFGALGLQEPLVNALTKLGFTTPTKIQAATMPQILAGDDVVMGAETGSGKTFSYGLPALHRALEQKDAWDDKPESLILVPNQELARQVALVLTSLGRADPELAVPITILAGSSGYVRDDVAAIYIGTPSAILRLTEPWQLEQVNLVVVDEADMLMDGGYVADLNKILKFLVPTVSQAQKRKLYKEGKTIEEAELPREPAQTVFAAATLPDWKGERVKSVVRDIQKRFPAARHISTEALHYQSKAAQHEWVDARGVDRFDILLQILKQHEGERTMVFTSTVGSCKEALEVLKDNGLDPLAIHKEVPPTERAEVLAVFKEEEGRVLLCTDLVARGVDIPNVQHVIQLDFAATAMMHLHRVGRTARAGGEGHVTNILDEMSWEIGETVRAEVGEGSALAPVFSRNRGFRRRLKRHGTGVAGRPQAGAPDAP